MDVYSVSFTIHEIRDMVTPGGVAINPVSVSLMHPWLRLIACGCSVSWSGVPNSGQVVRVLPCKFQKVMLLSDKLGMVPFESSHAWTDLRMTKEVRSDCVRVVELRAPRHSRWP